jgi:hypothetical protein
MSDPLNVFLGPEVVRIWKLKKMWHIDSESEKKCLRNNIEKLFFLACSYLVGLHICLGQVAKANLPPHWDHDKNLKTHLNCL